MRLLALSAALSIPFALPVTGCDDTAVSLRVSSNRKVPDEVDAFCLELDADGRPRYQHRFAATKFPQTLTVLPGSADSFVAQLAFSRQGLLVDDLRTTIGFRSHEVRDVNLSIDRCPDGVSSGQFSQLAAPALASAAAVAAVQTAAGPRLIVFAPGVVQELALAGGMLQPAPPARLPPPPPGTVTALAVADLDGNCDSDLVLAVDSGPPHVWRHDGAGGFAEVDGALPGDLRARGLAIADFDGDGVPDLVAVGPGARLLHGNGMGGFQEVTGVFSPAPPDPTCVAAGDLDGNGLPDLVIGQGTTTAAPALVYLNDGGRQLTSIPAALPPVAYRASALAIVDLDGDGIRDLVLVGLGAPVKLLRNRGNAFLEDRSYDWAPDHGNVDAVALAARDLDGDCHVDLVIALASGTPLMWAGTGGGLMASRMVGGAAGSASLVTIGDVNGDGARDVVLGGGGAGALWVQK
ncbi:MAG TPA: VCBS repeat-containing protein [Polyangia bacterium]|nr:VCBS repeat-containing protein [Polyangia bacterium]